MYNFLVVLLLWSQWDNIEAQLRECNGQISFRSSLPKICGTLGAASFGSGGRNADREELPWHAGIYSKKTRPYMQICGGSLVSSNVVISAAHCFWSDIQKLLPAEDYAVAVKKLYRPWNDPEDKKYAQKSDIREIRVPPRYQGSTTNFQDDLALLVLAQPFFTGIFVIPICLDFDYDLDAQHLTHGNIGKMSEAAALIPDPEIQSKNSNLPTVIRLYPKSPQNPTILDFSDLYGQGQPNKYQPPITPYNAEQEEINIQ